MNATCNGVTHSVRNAARTWGCNTRPEPNPNPTRSSLLTYGGCLTSDLWFFALVEIDHHLKSLTREPMMKAAKR